MIVCGLGTDCDGAAHLVVLLGDQVVYRTAIFPPIGAARATRWVNRIASRFSPSPLWIAVTDIKWHWLETLATLPVRWVHYGGGGPHDATSLARQLNLELQDQICHAFLRTCTERLTHLIEKEARGDPPDPDDVPF